MTIIPPSHALGKLKHFVSKPCQNHSIFEQIGRILSSPPMRSDGPSEVEFVVVNLFDSLEAVKRFAGPNYTVPVFEPEAKELPCRFEPVAMHYEVRVDTALS